MGNNESIKARPVSQDFWAEVGGERILVKQRTVFHGADDGSVLAHRLGTPRNIRDLQRTAEAFVRWADARFRPRCPSMFLAAASVTSEGLRAAMQHLAQDVCVLAPPMHAKGARHPKESRHIKDEVYWEICRTLNGFILLDELLLGCEKGSGRWGAEKSLRQFGNTVLERPLSVAFRHWFLEQAAPGGINQVRGDKKRLFAVQPRRRSGTKKVAASGLTKTASVMIDSGQVIAMNAHERQQALCEGLRSAVHALERLCAQDLFARGGSEQHLLQRQFAKTLRLVRSRANHARHIRRTNEITRDASALVLLADQWIRDCLPLQKRGNVANQSKARTLRRHVAYLYQYAAITDAHSRLENLLEAVVKVRLLCTRLVAQLKTISKCNGRSEKKVQRRKPTDFDRMVIKPGVVDGWRQALGDDVKAIGALCKAMASKRETGPWGRGVHVDLAFPAVRGVRQRIGDGKPVKARTARRLEEAFVDDLLVPMQAVGLAAEAPWDFLWERASKPNARLKSHKGKKWVLNPFGLLLVSDDVV